MRRGPGRLALRAIRGVFGDIPARGVLALLGCLVCQMGLGGAYVFAATLKHVVAEFEWSRAAYAAGGAPLLCSMALAFPWIGTAAERLGVRAVLSGSTLLLGLSAVLFSRMGSLWEFYLTSALLGIALAGLGDVAVGAVAARWAVGARGLALGFVYIGSNIGGAIVPPVTTAVAAEVSWRLAFVAIGVLGVLLILPFALFAVREPPSDFLPPDAPAPGGSKGEDTDLDLHQALRTRSFWILAGVLVAFYFYYLGVNQHLIAFLSDSGFSEAEAAGRFSFAVALGIASKLGVGALADRIPRKGALILNFAVLTAGSLALLFAATPGFLPVFLIAHGVATAAENVVLPLTVAEYFGVRHLARIYGVLMLALLPGGVLGPIFAGAVFDRLGSYQVAFSSFAAINAVALLALAFVRNERVAAVALARDGMIATAK